MIGRNRKRSASMSARAYGLGGRRGAAVRAMPCIIAEQHECTSPTRACHSTARGMGGVKGDARSLFPGCDAAHEEAGEHGTSQRAAFEERYSTDLDIEAERIAVELDERFGPEPCYLCSQVGTHAPLCRTVEALGARRAAQ